MITIDRTQYGFMSGRGTVDAVFVARQPCEKFAAKKKPLYWIFIDLEKAFDRVPRRLIIESLRHKRIPEHFINAIMATYDNCQTSFIVDGEPTDAFDVTVDVHQGSILSPLLFITIMDYLTEEVRDGSILEMLYVDDIALAAETPEEVMRKYRMWKSALESKGLRVNVGKTKGMGDFPSVTRIAAVYPCGVCGTRVGRNSIMCTLCRKWVHGRCTGIRGSLSPHESSFQCSTCQTPAASDPAPRNSFDELESVSQFCYLGHTLHATGDCEIAINERIKKAWFAFHNHGGVLLGKRGLSIKQRGFIYCACVRPVMTYSCETWTLKLEHKRRLLSTERRMARMMCGVTLLDRIPSDSILSRLGIQKTVIDCVEKSKLRWFGHVVRREDSNPIQEAYSLEVPGKRRKGRPRKTWIEDVKE